MNRYWFFCILLLAANLPDARADFFVHNWEDHHQDAQILQLGTDFLYYNTTSDFDPNGSTLAPFGLNSYQRELFEINATYGISSRFSAYARLSWEISDVNSSNPAAFSGTNYGFGDQTLGLTFRLYEKPGSMMLDLQAQADVPAYGNATAQANRTPFLGDGTTDVTCGAFVTIPLFQKENDEFVLVGGGGYTYRSGGFSSAIPWSVAAQLNPKTGGVVLGGGLYGVESLKTDVNTNNAALVDTTTNSFGTGGSYMTNAVNPSLINVLGKIGYLTSNDLEFTGTVGQSIWGREAPDGLTVAVGFQTHFGLFGAAASQKKEDAIYQSSKQYGRSNKGYIDYNLEAKVLRANDRFNLIKIDKGVKDGVRVGDVFDIFMLGADGTTETGAAIARGRVTDVKPAESALKIDEYFKEVWIEEGFIARRPID